MKTNYMQQLDEWIEKEIFTLKDREQIKKLIKGKILESYHNGKESKQWKK